MVECDAFHGCKTIPTAIVVDRQSLIHVSVLEMLHQQRNPTEARFVRMLDQREDQTDRWTEELRELVAHQVEELQRVQEKLDVKSVICERLRNSNLELHMKNSKLVDELWWMKSCLKFLVLCVVIILIWYFGLTCVSYLYAYMVGLPPFLDGYPCSCVEWNCTFPDVPEL